jgi:hypothetical protein
MSCFSRRSPSVLVVLVAAAIAVVVTAALTSWWVLLALIPLGMMTVCFAMMSAHPRKGGDPGVARSGCCAMVAPPAANAPPGRTEAAGAPVS